MNYVKDIDAIVKIAYNYQVVFKQEWKSLEKY